MRTSLSPDALRVIVARLEAGATPADIAQELGMSLTTLKTLLLRQGKVIHARPVYRRTLVDLNAVAPSEPHINAAGGSHE